MQNSLEFAKLPLADLLIRDILTSETYGEHETTEVIYVQSCPSAYHNGGD
jgi:hypothetical protein